MGRPPNPVGTAGTVRTYQLPNGTWKARTLVRDPDGRTRAMSRVGKSEAAARRALAAAVRDRVHAVRGTQVTPNTRLEVAADSWLADPATSKLAPRTVEQYARVVRVHIKPGLGALRVRELTVGTARAFLTTIEANHGAPTARMCRSVLSGIASWCAQRDAIDHNPVRDSGRISAKPARPPRSLTVAQALDLLMWAEYHDLSLTRDLPDFLRWMLATGLRIGEAAAVRPDDVDLDAGYFAVTGNIIRVTGVGLIRQEDESHKLNPRVLKLPAWAVALLRDRLDRRAVTAGRPLFPAPKGGWRDPSNTQADLRDLFAFAGYQWVTSHTLRKTVASLMEEAGLSARAGADQLGHRSPSMTLDRYWGRGLLDTGAADALSVLAPAPH